MTVIIDTLFGGPSNLALAILVTSGIGILFIGSALIVRLREHCRNRGKQGGKL